MGSPDRSERFTIVDMAGVEPDTRRGGEVRALLGPKSVGAESGFMGCVTLAPGDSVSEHWHPYSEEFLFLVRGSLTCRLDGEPYHVEAGQGIMTPIGIRHKLINEGDEEAFGVFHLGPLAPRPELGHVDTE